MSYIELAATYINPEVMLKVLENRGSTTKQTHDEEPRVQPIRVVTVGGMRFEQVNTEFNGKMKLIQTGGELEVKPINERIPQLRAELKAMGAHIYSMSDYYKRLGISEDTEILPDGS